MAPPFHVDRSRCGGANTWWGKGGKGEKEEEERGGEERRRRVRHVAYGATQRTALPGVERHAFTDRQETRDTHTRTQTRMPPSPPLLIPIPSQRPIPQIP